MTSTSNINEAGDAKSTLSHYAHFHCRFSPSNQNRDVALPSHTRRVRSTSHAKCKVIAMSIQKALLSKDLSQKSRIRQSVFQSPYRTLVPTVHLLAWSLVLDSTGMLPDSLRRLTGASPCTSGQFPVLGQALCALAISRSSSEEVVLVHGPEHPLRQR